MEYTAVEILPPSPAKCLGELDQHSDTDSTGATSDQQECGSLRRDLQAQGIEKCLLIPGAEELASSTYIAQNGLICHSDGDYLGTCCPSRTKEGTFMIWDWDDTLFPSSWINAQGMRLDDDFQPSDDQVAELEQLTDQVLHTLQVASSLGSLVIITNAEEGWVPLSCGKFMPRLKPVVDQFRIVSARTRFETVGVFSPLTWKVKCFAEEIRNHAGTRLQEPLRARELLNVISLGDSIHEREAMKQVARDLRSGCKTVKLPERPTLQDLYRCHSAMRPFLHCLVAHDGDLDLAVRLETQSICSYGC